MLCNLHPCCSRMVNNNDESEGIKFSMSYLVQTTKEVAKAFISAASAATVRCHLWSIVWRREWQPNAEWLVEKRVPSDSMIYICIELLLDDGEQFQGGHELLPILDGYSIMIYEFAQKASSDITFEVVQK